MRKPLKVLIVEDSEDDALLLVRALQQGGYEPTYLRVDRPETMKEALQQYPWEIVISDYSMPHFSGLEALALLKRTGQDVPFLIVSGTVGDELAVAAMKAGAQDYFMKNNLNRLVPAVERELEDARARRAQRRAEEELKKSERLQIVGRMAASIIHDFRSPMQIIQGSAEIMAMPETPQEQRSRKLHIIAQQIERMAKMTEDLLDFAKGQLRVRKTIVEIEEILRELDFLAGELLRDSRVRFYAEQKNSFQLLADKDKILRVMLNLIRNAKEAMPGEGEIKVTAELQGMDGVIRVSDTGPGIPAELRDRLFEPFATHGKSGGTGLGLALSKKIIQDHNGAIDWQSEPGKGTTFIIRLPAGQKVAVTSPDDDKTGKIII